jgi:hypothetical protein
VAKSVLRAGAEIDFLSGDDLERQMAGMRDFFEALVRGEEGETISRAAGSFQTDASGGTSSLGYGGADVYRVPTGFNAYLTRLSVDYEGSNAASPQSCDVRICADQVTPSALRAINNSVPTVFSAGRSHAPLFRAGQRVILAMSGGPHSTYISVTVQVILTKIPGTHADATEPSPAGRLGDPLDRP